MGDCLGLSRLQFVMDRMVHEALQEAQVLQLFLGQALEFGWVSRWEGEDLGDVHTEHMLRVDAPLKRGHDRAGVVAVGAVPVITEPSHQHRPCVSGAQGVPAGLGRRPGEGEAGQRRDDYMEGIGRVTSVRPRVGERLDQVDVLQKRVGPAVSQDQWDGVGLG